MTLVTRDDEVSICAFWGMAGAVIVMAEPQWPQKFAPASNSAPHARQRRINRSPFRRLAQIFPERLVFLMGFYSPVGVRASVVSARFFGAGRVCSAPHYALFASMRSRATFAQRAVSSSTVT
jgi:hypothetical protein